MNPARCPFCGKPGHDGPAGPCWHSLSVPPGWGYHDDLGEVPLPDGEPDPVQLEAETASEEHDNSSIETFKAVKAAWAEKATAGHEAEKNLEEVIEAINVQWAASSEEGASHPVLWLDLLLGLLDSFEKAWSRWRATVQAERNTKRELWLAGRRLFRMLGLG
jgi:hypothetical protein